MSIWTTDPLYMALYAAGTHLKNNQYFVASVSKDAKTDEKIYTFMFNEEGSILHESAYSHQDRIEVEESMIAAGFKKIKDI